MSFWDWDSLFESPQSKAEQDIYSGWSALDTPEAIERKYGLKKRKASDISQVFNPARGVLATRQAQANQAAGARMSGANATPQGTFGAINSEYANAFGDLEDQAAKTGLNIERSDEENVAKYLRGAQEGRQQAAQGLSKSSGLDDILSVASTAAKFFPPTAAIANIAGAVKTASDILGGGNNSPAPDYGKMFSTPNQFGGNSAIPFASTTQPSGKLYGRNRTTGETGYFDPNDPDVDFI